MLKKIMIIAGILVALFIVAYSFVFFTMSRMYWGHPKNYEYSSVVEMFQTHKEDMEKINEIYFHSGLDFRSKPDGGIILSYSSNVEEYFAPNEWSVVRKFFIDTKPYSIEVYTNLTTIEYVFSRKEGNAGENYGIFYTKDEEAYYLAKGGFTVFEELALNWYLGYG